MLNNPELDNAEPGNLELGNARVLLGDKGTRVSSFRTFCLARLGDGCSDLFSFVPRFLMARSTDYLGNPVFGNCISCTK